MREVSGYSVKRVYRPTRDEYAENAEECAERKEKIVSNERDREEEGGDVPSNSEHVSDIGSQLLDSR